MGLDGLRGSDFARPGVARGAPTVAAGANPVGGDSWSSSSGVKPSRPRAGGNGGERTARGPPPLRPIASTSALLAALSALKKGDFSVRLPVEWTGVAGKIADTFNDVVELNERMAQELERLSRVVGKEGQDHPARLARRRHRRLGRVDRLGQRADRRPGPPDQRDGARHRRRGPGRPLADDGARDRRPPAAGRVPAHRQDRQHDGGPARRRSPPR